jgi:hypothetical protein
MCSMDISPRRANPMSKEQVLEKQQTAFETASATPPPPKRKSSLSSHTNKKTVKFDCSCFQEHAVILGDNNPGVQTGGPSVTIDWEPLRQYPLHLDQYGSAIGTRRSIQELRMPATVRQELYRVIAACRK